MLFNSYIFIFLFLPLAVCGYYLLNHFHLYRPANLFLFGVSLWFYGYFNPSYLLIICLSIAVNYLLSCLMARLPSASLPKRLVLFLGLFFNLSLLFYFKYYDFFINTVNAVFRLSFSLKHIALPLGISFFTFQQLSFLIDSYRGEVSGYSFDEYALFVSFFPQLVAGPIVLHSEMLPQLKNPENRRFRPDSFSKGVYVFALGLFKKVIIADALGMVVTYGYGLLDSLSAMEALITSLCYTFQLYFDFSGYCDMALGIGFMFNITLPQNFDSPYKALSITEFWSRWHMTLTRFLRSYIYFPLGGSRKGTFRKYCNIMIVFFVSGLWHGANWTFVLWGVLHGLLNCLNRMFEKQWNSLSAVTRWAATFMAVNVLLIVFRSDSVSDALVFIRRLVSLQSLEVRAGFYSELDAMLPVLVFFEQRLPLLRDLFGMISGFNLWLFLFGSFFAVLNFRNSSELVFRPTVARALAASFFLFLSVVSFAGVSTFLYFDF